MFSSLHNITIRIELEYNLFYLSHTRLYREYITSSEMYSLHLTHPKWTHTRSSGQQCYSARGAVGGSVPCSRTPQSWYWRRRERWLFTPPTNNPCRTWDSNPQPLNYESDSLTIRPRLPRLNHWWQMEYPGDGVSWRCFSYFSGPWQCNLLGSQWDSHKPPGFHPKYLKLCSEDEQSFYGFGTTWE